jgi:pimeloyl-ACP methyl ester carboxylesterase
MSDAGINDIRRLQVGRETISFATTKVGEDRPTLLFLHGAGTSSGERVSYLTALLARVGRSSVAIDFSGHGESTGTLPSSSLNKRTQEAKALLTLFTDEQPIGICGSSMGAHVAIRMLEFSPSENLFLFCPAVYSSAAYDVQFDQGFSKIIREPGSWLQSETFSILKNYEGRVLIFMGERDEVVPSALPGMLIDSAERAKRKELVIIPSADHKLHAWLQHHPSDAQSVVEKMADYLGTTLR